MQIINQHTFTNMILNKLRFLFIAMILLFSPRAKIGCSQTADAFDANQPDNWPNANLLITDANLSSTQVTTYKIYLPIFMGEPPEIAFVSNRDGNYEIYVMNADGSRQTRLTNNSSIDNNPRWSPDGTRLTFISNRDGNYEIYVIDPSSAALTNLTNDSADDSKYAWSPDGSKIAFVSNRDGSNNLYVMDFSGSNVKQLTANQSGVFCYTFTWSPDSTKIAFSSTCYGEGNLYIVNNDGTGLSRITDLVGGWVTEPAWSPDGKLIAFVFKHPLSLPILDSPDLPPSTYSDIYVLNLANTEAIRLVNGFYHQPAWSPNGKKIGAIYNPSSTYPASIYTMNADGTELTELIPAYMPVVVDFVWLPNDDQIAYSATDFVGGPDIEIYLVNTDGSMQINLTNNPASDFGLAWRR